MYAGTKEIAIGILGKSSMPYAQRNCWQSKQCHYALRRLLSAIRRNQAGNPGNLFSRKSYIRTHRNLDGVTQEFLDRYMEKVRVN